MKYLVLLLIISISFAFDCSGLDENECNIFTFNNTFVKDPHEKAKILQKFYEDHFDESTRKKLEIIVKENGVINF